MAILKFLETEVTAAQREIRDEDELNEADRQPQENEERSGNEAEKQPQENDERLG